MLHQLSCSNDLFPPTANAGITPRNPLKPSPNDRDPRSTRPIPIRPRALSPPKWVRDSRKSQSYTFREEWDLIREKIKLHSHLREICPFQLCAKNEVREIPSPPEKKETDPKWWPPLMSRCGATSLHRVGGLSASPLGKCRYFLPLREKIKQKNCKRIIERDFCERAPQRSLNFKRPMGLK